MEKPGTEPEIFGVVDKLSTAYGNTLAGCFVPNSTKIALRPFKPIIDRDVPEVGNDPSHIHIIKPEFIFEDSILRSLLTESNTTFAALQALKRRASMETIANISRTYRSIIRACLEKLHNVTGKERTAKNGANVEAESYQQYISIFYFIECVWHLCEIFFMDPTPANVVVPHLLDWIRFHFPADERLATDLLLSGPEAGNDSDYWPTLKGLVMQGHLEITHALLQLHSSAESAAFTVTSQILKAMPTYDAMGSLSIQKFRSQWEYWKTDTERKLDANILAVEPQLEVIIKLVLGDATAWNSEILNSKYWYEYFPGFLFYTNPACKHFELGNAANDWLIRWAKVKDIDGQSLQLKLLDQVILRLMENDFNQVIHRIQTIGDNQWFVTHITDLLYNCGKLHIVGERQVDESAQLRSSLIFEFGSMLMTCDNLWQVGIDYLEQCGTEGQGAIELILPRLCIRSEKMALRIISIARQRKYLNTEQEICKILSKRSFDDGRYGNALEWAIRSKDTIVITSIADFILKHYKKTGDMLCPDIIGKLGGKMFISARLVFLCKYFEFYTFYRMREFLQAAETYVVLLESKSTPEYFWPSLLIDAIPLLESKDPKLFSKETCAVLEHLETNLIPLIQKTKNQAEKDPATKHEILKDYRIENIEEIINLIRLACARNLSRSIVIEGTLKGL